MSDNTKPKIVVIGGGFAGLHFIENIKENAFDILLIDKLNHHQFQPLFYQVATSQIEPSSISFPFRKIFQVRKDGRIRKTKVEGIDSTNHLQHGFPDALARLDLDTARRVPWDGNVPFFLGDFVDAAGAPFAACPRQTLKRVLARGRKLGFEVKTGYEFEWFNFAETPQSWAAKKGVGPESLTPGMFGYSLLRMADQRGFFNALMDDMAAFGVPNEGLHTETGPGVYEAAIAFSARSKRPTARSSSRPVPRRSKKHGVMPSFMAKWSQQYPGCSGHIHQSLSDGKSNRFYDAKSQRSMSALFESYLAGQIECLMQFGPIDELSPKLN